MFSSRRSFLNHCLILLRASAGLGQLQPIPAGAVGLLRGDYFHDLAVFQLIIDGHHPAVDFGAHHPVAHRRMDGVGKIDGRGPLGQVDHIALWRKDKDLVAEQVHLDVLNEIFRLGILLGFQQLPDPGKSLFVLFAFEPVFVLPVGRHAVFRRPVHLFGADLHFKGDALPADDHRVQRLVPVGLGRADVVLEPPGHRPVQVVDKAQHIVAVGQLIHDDPHGADVVQFRKVQILGVHLAVNTVNMLDPGLDLTLDAHAFQLFLDPGLHPLQKVLILLALVLHLVHDLFVAHWVQVFDADIFQLRLDVLDAQPVGQRRIDIHGLQRFFPLLIFRQILECAGVVQPVRQFDDDDPDIFGHGNEHLAQVLHLGLFFAAVDDLAQAGDAVDQVCHRPAEFFFDVHIGDVGIFQTVVEQAGHDGIGIHAQFGQNARHCHRMDEIGFTAAALLALMGFFRKIIGLRDLLHIGKRRMLLHFFQQCLQAIIGLIHKPNPILYHSLLDCSSSCFKMREPLISALPWRWSTVISREPSQGRQAKISNS